MPSFRNKLTEEQRWQLVIFVRSFSGAIGSSPAQPQASEPPKNEIKK
jgi:hypothetical protein